MTKISDEQFELNALEQLETMPELCAWCYKRGGEEELRALLAHSSKHPSYREFYERTAIELEEIGLPHVAALVWETAEQLPSEFDKPCPFRPDLETEVRVWWQNNEASRNHHQAWLKEKRTALGSS